MGKVKVKVGLAGNFLWVDLAGNLAGKVCWVCKLAGQADKATDLLDWVGKAVGSVKASLADILDLLKGPRRRRVLGGNQPVGNRQVGDKTPVQMASAFRAYRQSTGVLKS